VEGQPEEERETETEEERGGGECQGDREDKKERGGRLRR